VSSSREEELITVTLPIPVALSLRKLVLYYRTLLFLGSSAALVASTVASPVRAAVYSAVDRATLGMRVLTKLLARLQLRTPKARENPETRSARGTGSHLSLYYLNFSLYCASEENMLKQCKCTNVLHVYPLSPNRVVLRDCLL
jgi:hypothetical protein